MRIQCVYSVALSASLLMLSSTFGQQEEPKKPEAKSGETTTGATSPPQVDKPKESIASKKPTTKSKGLLSAMGQDGMVNRRIAGLLRLHAAIDDKFKLSKEKKKSIDKMFDDYITKLLGPEPPPVFTPDPEDVTPPQEIPRLEKELAAAQESGDTKAAASIQAKINAAKMVLEPSIFDTPMYFLNAIAVELGQEHNEDFRKIAQRWHALRVREIAPDSVFKRLVRSIRDPELDLSDAERKELMEVLGKALRDVPFSDRNDPVKASELKATLLPMVLEKLKPEQREHIERTMAMLEKWSTEDEEAVASVRSRLSGRSPNSDPPPSRPKEETPAPSP